MIFKFKDRSEWHDWFAWRPVLTEHGQLVWWQTIKRRYVDVGRMDYDYRWQKCLPGEEW